MAMRSPHEAWLKTPKKSTDILNILLIMSVMHSVELFSEQNPQYIGVGYACCASGSGPHFLINIEVCCYMQTTSSPRIWHRSLLLYANNFHSPNLAISREDVGMQG